MGAMNGSQCRRHEMFIAMRRPLLANPFMGDRKNMSLLTELDFTKDDRAYKHFAATPPVSAIRN